MKNVSVVQIEAFYPEDTWHLSGINIMFSLHVVFYFYFEIWVWAGTAAICTLCETAVDEWWGRK